jgi:hypothetical protein
MWRGRHEKEVAAGLSSDGNRDNGEDKNCDIPSGRRRRAGQKAGTGETLGGLMCVGPAREGLVLRVGASTAGPKNGLGVETGIQTMGRTPYNVGIAQRVVADNRMVAPNC